MMQCLLSRHVNPNIKAWQLSYWGVSKRPMLLKKFGGAYNYYHVYPSILPSIWNYVIGNWYNWSWMFLATRTCGPKSFCKGQTPWEHINFAYLDCFYTPVIRGEYDVLILLVCLSIFVPKFSGLLSGTDAIYSIKIWWQYFSPKKHLRNASSVAAFDQQDWCTMI
jgi:hypothetical protein